MTPPPSPALSATAAPPPGRYLYIDSLRALAALLVLWAHCAEAFMYIALDRPGAGQWMHHVARQWDFGRIGVAVFFAISGFVIVPSLRGPRGEGLRRFAIARFFRLFPAYWLSILPGAYIFWWLWGKPFALRDLLLNFTMVPEALGAKAALGVYWTLEAELCFYVLCALLFCIGWVRRPLALMGVAVLCAVAGALYKRHTGASEDWLGMHLSIMLFGGALRLWLESPRRSVPVAAALGLYLLAWGVAALAAGRAPQGALPPQTVSYMHCYVIALAIFVLGTTVIRVRSRLLAWLGRISYSIYLLHPVALYIVLWQVSHAPEGSPWGHFHIAAYSSVVAAMTVGMAWACFRWVELPAMALGKRLAGAPRP